MDNILNIGWSRRRHGQVADSSIDQTEMETFIASKPHNEEEALSRNGIIKPRKNDDSYNFCKYFRKCITILCACIVLFILMLLLALLFIYFETHISDNYSLESNVIMYSSETQAMHDINNHINQYTLYSNINNKGTKIAIGLGFYKGGTQFLFETTKYLMDNDTLFFDDRRQYGSQELNYFNTCTYRNLLYSIKIINFIYKNILANIPYLSDYVNEMNRYNDNDDGCTLNDYVKFGWGKMKTVSFLNSFINKNTSQMILYEKSVQYIDNPAALKMLALYSKYINNLSFNRKYYPNGIIKFWIMLRDPTIRTYSNIYWQCLYCNSTIIDNEFIYDRINYFTNEHKYYSPMLKYIDELANNKKNEFDSSDINTQIKSLYTNAIYYDVLSMQYRFLFDNKYTKMNSTLTPFAHGRLDRQKRDNYMKRALKGRDLIEFSYFYRENKLGTPMMRSCYYPSIKMLYDFYYYNTGSGKNTDDMDIPLKIIQHDKDKDSNEYISNMVQEYICWVKNIDCKSINEKDRIDLDKIKIGKELHQNDPTSEAHNYRPVEMNGNVKKELKKFYSSCNIVLKQFIDQNKHLLMTEDVNFHTWD